MENFQCLTCGVILPSNTHYHFHNVTSHTVDELSATILNLLLRREESFLISQKIGDLKCSNKVKKNESKKNDGGFFRECMDEVIELGPIEGADNLTVQSLFLKSNFTPNSRHIIEVEEKKHSQHVIKVLSEELNAAVVHFQNEFLSTGVIGCPDIQLGRSTKSDEAYSDLTIGRRKSRKRKKHKRSTPHKRRKTEQHPTKISAFSGSKDGSRFVSTSVEVKGESDASKPNVPKLVLRSGRAIKTNPRYEDFVYYHDDFKENSHKNVVSHSQNWSPNSKSIVRSVSKRSAKSARPDARHRPGSSDQSDFNKHIPFEPLNNKILDFLAQDLNLSDWNFSNELDISIEDLDLTGFDDLGGTLPENQILTIENLLQELDGGGSIEISNIIKENNVDSDTVVLDALSQGGNTLPKELLPDLEELVTAKQTRKTKLVPRNRCKPNYCEICSKQYINRSHFISHREKCHIKCNKMLYKCTTCDKVFEFLSAFEKHVKDHNPKQTFICEFCGRNFKKLLNLKIHFALHKKEKMYECDQCPKKYYLKYSYLRHLKSHTTEGKYRCDECDKNFTHKLHFMKHLDKHKTGKYLGLSNDYKCNFCNDVKTTENLKTLSESGQRFITCLVCKKGLYKKYLLQNKDYIHTSGGKELTKEKCKICGKSVKHLKKHIRETHLSNPVVQCDICGQSVKKSSLSAHKHRAHSGVASKCDHCSKVFKNALALNEHINKVKSKKII